MGIQWRDLVITTLQQGGHRVRRGYPVGKFPYLTAPAIAVCVEKITADSTILRLDIYSPLQQGGEKCEDTAAAVFQLLTPIKGIVSVGPCRFDESLGLFTQSVQVEFIELKELISG